MATKEKLLEWADYLETPGLKIGSEYYFINRTPCCGIGHIVHKEIDTDLTLETKDGELYDHGAARVLGMSFEQVQEFTNLNNSTEASERGKVLASYLRKIAEEV